MKRLFLLALLSLVLGGGVIALMQGEPGYLLLAYGDYTLESSLWIGLLMLAVLVLLLYVLLRLLHGLLAAPEWLAFWATSRRRRQSARLTQRGLMSFLEGNWKRSRRQLQRGAVHSDAPSINYLMAARASFQLEDRSRMQDDLEAALAADSGSAVAVGIVQAELQLRSGQYARALASLDRAEQHTSRTPHTLRLRSKAMLALGDWEGLRALLPELKKHGVLPPRKLARLRRQTHLRLLEVAAGDLGDNTAVALQRAWRQTPGELQADTVILLRYIELLADADVDAAIHLIVRTLKKRWDPRLVSTFGRLAAGDPERQLALAESWLTGREQDPQLLLCLARLTARQQFWAQARDYYERSINVNPGEEACAELGHLLAASGNYLQASKYFCAGLALQGHELPGLADLPEDVSPPERPATLELELKPEQKG